jgi:hypothetical protein
MFDLVTATMIAVTIKPRLFSCSWLCSALAADLLTCLGLHNYPSAHIFAYGSASEL